MKTIIRNITIKKPARKRVLEKVEISIPFEEKNASTTKKSGKKKIA